MSEARARWSRFAAGDFDGDDLPALLRALSAKWQPGTLAAELGRALAEGAEGDADERSPISIEAWESIPKTGRIDGILPLTIPSPTNLGLSVLELREEIARLEIGSPGAGDDDEIGLAILALLHDRPLVTDHRLALRLYIDCPADSLMLMGRLPLGGTVSIFTSAIGPDRAAELPGSALRHVERSEARRDRAGKLRLDPLPPREGPRPETWTFRL